MTVKLLFYNLPVISSITISSTLNKVVWLAMIAKWARKKWHIPFKRQLKNRGRFLERPGIAFWARRQILKSKPVECSSTIPGVQTRQFFFVKLSFQNYWNFDLERKHGNKNSFSGPKSTGTIEKRVPGALFLPLPFHTEGKSYLYTFGNAFHSTFQILRIQLVL